MMDFLAKYKKTVIGGILALVLIIGVSVYFIVDDMAKTAKVKIVVSPSIATVKIDGKAYGTYGEFKVRPGEYTVEISAEGFEPKNGKLKAVENETVEIKTYLEIEEGNNYYAEHPEDAVVLGDIKAAETLEKVEELKGEYPILEKLPLEIDYYTNDYAKRVKYTITYELNEDKDGFTIMIIDYTGGNYADAIAKLTARGADSEKYAIEYRDVTSESEWGRAN